LAAKVSDLEKRAIEALRADREDLAVLASEAIAAMATQIDASERASQRFSAEVVLARREVDVQRRRLSGLDRGRRLAKVGSALTATTFSSRSGLDSFSEAESTLARVVAENQDARAVQEEMAPTAEFLIERMSAAGFGDPVQVRPSDGAVADRNQPAVLIESKSNSQ
jgi:phage shock protein A